MIRLWAAVLSAALMSGLGCALLGIEEQRAVVESFGGIRGSVRLDRPATGPLVVVLGRAAAAPSSDVQDEGAATIADHFTLARAGEFAFAVSPGRYRLAAFEDHNSNLRYDPGEPALAQQLFFDVGLGVTIADIALVIPRDSSLSEAYDILALEARSPMDQRQFSLGRFTVAGEVVELSDAKFVAENGERGLWRFAEFLLEVGPGVYFLEAYDPDKIPVLFVHGISGYPQQFTTLIEHLDRERYQPWFYFYPSGFHLDGVARHLSSIVTDLQVRHRFKRMAVVAHSMGGLVSRSFILKHYEQTGRSDVELFVAISSPWGGNAEAAGAKNAPTDMTIYSWLDMGPESDFLRGLFHLSPDYERVRPLPPHAEFHMLFGFAKGDDSMGPSSDGVVTLKSATRRDAVNAARSLLPLDYSHTGILHAPESSERLNAILDGAFR